MIARPFAIAWATLAILASVSIARILAAPEPKHGAASARADDFLVPADVRGLQGTSNLDVIERGANGGFVLSGWIADERTHRPGESMYVDVDGTTRIAGTYGESRPDVAAAFASPDLQNVGFHVVIRPGQLETGAHRVRLGITVGGERFESVRRYPLP